MICGGAIPSFIWITDGKVHDVNVLDILVPEPSSICHMDRACLDFKRLYELHQCSAIFVTLTKTNTKLRRIYSHKVDKTTSVRCDKTAALSGFCSNNDYPEKLRRVKFYDSEKGRSFVFLTNQFMLPAYTIAELYRYRRRVEFFFKWIKQHLRIKSFYGTSQNAVKTQIRIAISTYVLAAMMKKRLKVDLPLYTILQSLSITLFEKMPVLLALTADGYRNKITSSHIAEIIR